jgi:FKBP-type peptidyl-prolyl cis-trans isomerase FkpA
MMRLIFWGCWVSVLLTFSSCLPDNEEVCTKVVDTAPLGIPPALLERDVAAIDSYLAANSITAVKDPQGVRYVVSQPGTNNDTPCLESRVRVIYTGKLLATGDVFDSSTVPVDFPLAGLITGWQIAFPKLTRGSKATLYIPSVLAYGSRAVGKIPPNSNLIFEVELLDF